MNPDKKRVNAVGPNRIKHVMELVFQAKILLFDNADWSESNGSREDDIILLIVCKLRVIFRRLLNGFVFM